MSETETKLAELLERATSLEAEKAELKGDDDVAVIDPPEADPEAPEVPPTVEELQEKVAQLEDEVFALQNSTPAGPAEEPPAGVDFDDADAELDSEPVPVEDADLVTPTPDIKAAGWAPCPSCGSTNADEYADGTARCEDCGSVLHKLEGKADDEIDALIALPLEAKDDLEAGATSTDGDPGPEDLEAKGDTLEVEQLLARRARLST